MQATRQGVVSDTTVSRQYLDRRSARVSVCARKEGVCDDEATCVILRLVATVRIACHAAALCVFVLCGCATPASSDSFDGFLQRIAAECKPLIIGSDDFGQAIVFNGLGAAPDHYNIFIARTQALYGGGISPQIYRESLTAFVGAGSYNARSFDCIVAHLPRSATPGAAPAK